MPDTRGEPQLLLFPLYDRTQAGRLSTGAKAEAEVCKDGGTIYSATNPVTHVGSGLYALELTDDEKDAAVVAVVVRAKDCSTCTITITTDSAPVSRSTKARRMIAAIDKRLGIVKRPTRAQMQYLRRQERDAQTLQDDLAGELATAYGSLGARAERAAERVGLARTPTPEDEQRARHIADAMDFDDWRNDELAPVYERFYSRVSELTVGAVTDSLGVDIGIGLPDDIARAVVAAGGKQIGLQDIPRTTRNSLFQALAKAREDGLGPDAAGRVIRQFVGAGRFVGLEEKRAGAGVRYRAELIARTETKFAQNIATAEAGNAAGFGLYLAFDNRTGFDDEECMARDGQTFTYAEMLQEIAEEHPNGTLSFAPVPGSQVA